MSVPLRSTLMSPFDVGKKIMNNLYISLALVFAATKLFGGTIIIEGPPNYDDFPEPARFYASLEILEVEASSIQIRMSAASGHIYKFHASETLREGEWTAEGFTLSSAHASQIEKIDGYFSLVPDEDEILLTLEFSQTLPKALFFKCYTNEFIGEIIPPSLPPGTVLD